MRKDFGSMLAGLLLMGAAVAPAAAADKTVTIGWTSYPADLNVIADAIDGGKAEAAKLGAKLTFALSAGAIAQANAMDSLINAGVDVIAIDPEDSTAIGTSIKKANEAKIPVIMWIGDNLGGGDTVTLISSDEEQGGYNQAHWAFEKLGGKGTVALIQGTKAHQAGRLREEGFRRAMKEFPGIELVGYGEANWTRDRANSLASDILSRTPDVQMFVVLSDDMAAGVYSAVKAAGSKAMIVGYNGTCEVLSNVWNGGMTADLYQGWRDIGGRVVQASVDIANGRPVDKKIIMPTFTVDKALMEKIKAGDKGNTTEGLQADVAHALAGCK